MLPKVSTIISLIPEIRADFFIGNASPALFLLSILLHIDLSTFILLLPIILILITNPHSHLASPHQLTANLRCVVPLFGEYLSYTCILALASTIIAGGVQWVPQTWGATYVLPFCSCTIAI